MNIAKLSLEELQILKREIEVLIRSHRGSASEAPWDSAYRVGMKVSVDHRSHYGEVFTITKVNRVKCKIENTNGERFTCSKHMLSEYKSI
tara:strand:- start:687 stop:956 length:270 start_codon:yes stop_codon:yes gene_type:complete